MTTRIKTPMAAAGIKKSAMLMKHMEERRSTAPGATALLLAAGVLLAGCSQPKPPAAGAGAGMGPIPVTVQTAQASNVPVQGAWVGTMDGRVNAQIQPQVSGYLIKQDYREGAEVAKDQVLFEIDPRPFQAVLDQANGQLQQAQASLALANINVKRDTPLVEAHAIAKSQLDTETQQAAEAEASVAAAKAAVETAQINLGFTKVRSLIAGVAGQATTQVGNLVSAASVLTAVSQLNPIRVYFSISDSEYLSLVDQAKSRGGDLLHGHANVPLSLTLADGREYPYKGQIEFVDRQMNAQTAAIRLAALFPNPGNVLRPNQLGRVHAQTTELHNAILVPQAVVNELQGQPQVYTVTPQNTVHIVNVVLGPQIGQQIVITSGVTAGTKLIADRLQILKEGMPVKPQEGSAVPATSIVSQSLGK